MTNTQTDYFYMQYGLKILNKLKMVVFKKMSLVKTFN